MIIRCSNRFYFLKRLEKVNVMNMVKFSNKEGTLNEDIKSFSNPVAEGSLYDK